MAMTERGHDLRGNVREHREFRVGLCDHSKANKGYREFRVCLHVHNIVDRGCGDIRIGLLGHGGCHHLGGSVCDSDAQNGSSHYWKDRGKITGLDRGKSAGTTGLGKGESTGLGMPSLTTNSRGSTTLDASLFTLITLKLLC